MESIPDFFEITAGEVYEFPGIEAIDDGSQLPYAWIRAPLPNDSKLSPRTDYRLNIHKASLVVHSVSFAEAQSSRSCEKRKKALISLLEQEGFSSSTEDLSATKFRDAPHRLGDQIASFRCSRFQGVPFFELELQITTEAEHEKFEKRMRDFGRK